MSVLVIDSHGSHAQVVKLLLSLGTYDIIYYSDTRTAPLDELSAFTRVSRLLMLLHAQCRQRAAIVVLLGRGMASTPREAVEFGARQAGVQLIYGADILADRICSTLGSGLCLVGDSCLTANELRHRLGQRDLVEVRWCRIAPVYRDDEPLIQILKGWGRVVSDYVLSTPDNKRVASQILRHETGAEITDEYETLALALSEILPEASTRRLQALVTELGAPSAERIRARLDLNEATINEMGPLEQAPTEGPYSMSLDAEGSPYY